MADFLFLKAECNTAKRTARMIIPAAFICAAIFILFLSSAAAWASSGQQKRIILCQRTDGVAVNPANCNPATYPGITPPKPLAPPAVGTQYGPSDSPCTDVQCNDSKTCACAVYEWYQSGWGPCSVTCGGGTRIQTVYCQDKTVPGIPVSDSMCVAAGPKPPFSQACNTQSCCVPVCGPPTGTCGGTYADSCLNPGACTNPTTPTCGPAPAGTCGGGKYADSCGTANACTNSAPCVAVCGDGICNFPGSEDHCNCPADCDATKVQPGCVWGAWKETTMCGSETGFAIIAASGIDTPGNPPCCCGTSCMAQFSSCTGNGCPSTGINCHGNSMTPVNCDDPDDPLRPHAGWTVWRGCVGP